jgi:predicted amidohydrolase YtcJ
MKSIKKIYSNLNFADPKTGEPNPMTIYVKNGFIEKVTDEKLDIGIDYIDCNNSFVLPGFTDGHGHMTHLGKTQYEVDLSNCKSESDVIFDIEKFHKENSNLDWIIGGGWNQENWDKKILPNNYKLSKKFPAIPVVMIRVDGHAMWANKKAIEIAGINGETINPDGGEIL